MWRAAKRLTAAGRPTKPDDLCIAMTYAREPCGKSATQRIVIGPERGTVEPFCDLHYRELVKAILESKFISIINAVEVKLWREEQEAVVQAKARAQGGPKFTYFARKGDLVKIGFTTSVKTRLRSLETAGGFTFDEVVYRPGGRAVEGQYHERFATTRVLGEWFDMSPAIRNEMDRIVQRQEAVKVS